MDARWLLGGGFDPVHFHAARSFRIRLTSHASLSKNPFPKQPTTHLTMQAFRNFQAQIPALPSVDVTAVSKSFRQTVQATRFVLV